MAAHLRDDVLHGRDHTDSHLDAGRWHHQERTAYAKHVGHAPREPDSRDTVDSLTDFLNKNRAEPLTAEAGKRQSQHAPLIPAASEATKLHEKHGVQGVYGSNVPTVKGRTEDGEIMSGNGEVGGGPDAVDEGYGVQNKTGVGMQEPTSNGTTAESHDGREVRCGPLLNYRRMDQNTWYGSVLIVVRGGGTGDTPFSPRLLLSRSRAIYEDGMANGNHNSSHGITAKDGESQEGREIGGVKLYSDPRNTFWRFTLDIEMDDSEVEWVYKIPGLRFASDKTDEQRFFVPAKNESMRIMFHSCNGFSAGTDEEAWSGACLWNDVMRRHKDRPFHVMIGGGDQIYNDGIRVSGPLRPWTDIGNPKKRREYPFPEKLRKQCDDYYVSNYIKWYSTEPFAEANGQIPQLNLWDDHDIIDGFGSYVHEFMKCPVFRGLGGTAQKYYLLFQHHLAPPVSTYTTDAPQTMSADLSGPGADPAQLKDTYVLENGAEDPSYIIGPKPGPYVAERSRSIYARLGARIGFFGIDARTERTRHQVNYPETYELIFSRLHAELSSAASSPSPIQHLIVLLGVPIAYPRLTWLENIFSSPLLGPIKFLNKRFGLGGGFFNKFDGSVELLDDLDDHYTSRTHKRERHDLILRLQALAAEFSVRVTILGGDVHLAAVGRFYSNPKLKVPVEADHRYMANIISSAIVNKPPPQAVANLLARRNKLHHLDENTDETLLKMFDSDPGEAAVTSNANHVTMPSRNWAMLTENSPRTGRSETRVNGAGQGHGPVNGNPTPSLTNGHNPEVITNGDVAQPQPASTSEPATNGTTTTHHSDPKHETIVSQYTGKDGHSPLHEGEATAGTQSRAANNTTHGVSTSDGSLDVSIRVERDQHDAEGTTTAYGLWIPVLRCQQDAGERVLRKRDAVRGAANARVGQRAHE